MNSRDKIELIQGMGVIDILDQLMPKISSASSIAIFNSPVVQSITSPVTQNQKDEDEELVEFREHVAKLVNCIGVELCKCFEDKAMGSQEATLGMIHKLFPYFLNFLEDEYDNTSSATFPFLNAYIAILKKHCTTGNDGRSVLASHLHNNFFALLRTVVMKMKYHPDDESSFAENAGDDEIEFIEMRKVKFLLFLLSLFLVEPSSIF